MYTLPDEIDFLQKLEFKTRILLNNNYKLIICITIVKEK